jgi:hypothetical protein
MSLNDLCTVCETALRVCASSMVTLDRGRQGVPGESAEESGQDGEWAEHGHLEGRLLELGLTPLEERRHRLDMQQTY